MKKICYQVYSRYKNIFNGHISFQPTSSIHFFLRVRRKITSTAICPLKSEYRVDNTSIWSQILRNFELFTTLFQVHLASEEDFSTGFSCSYITDET